MSATGNGFTETSFTFLSDLTANNDSAWFDQNRQVFTQYVDEPFAALLEGVTARLADTPIALRGGSATMFRINRDVRFSADKSPYSTSRSGLLTPSGTKAESAGLVYVQLDVAGGFLAGGLYKPQTPQLDPLRRAMVDDPAGFTRVVAALAAGGRELDRSDAVKTMPRGYADHVGHPQADNLRLKQLIVTEALSPQVWLDDTVADRIVDFTLGVAPLIDYVRALAGPAQRR